VSLLPFRRKLYAEQFLFAFCNTIIYSLAPGPVHRVHILTGTFAVCRVFSSAVCSVGLLLLFFGLVITSFFSFNIVAIVENRFDLIGVVFPPFHYFVCFCPIPFSFLYGFTVTVFFYFYYLPITETFLVCLVTHLPVVL
jgi:hypothetical protein